jgi:hypothetical protein
MSEPKPKPAVNTNNIQDDIFLRLVEATANAGTFALGELKSGDEVQKIAKHLRGVSEIIASVWEDK